MPIRGLSALAFAILLSAPLSAAPPPQELDQYQQGKIDLDGKRYREAEVEFANAEAKAPGTTNALALRAKALVNLKRFEESEQCLRAYLQGHPDSVDASYLLAYVLFRRNLPAESLAAYTTAARLRRPAADDLKVVGLDYVLLGDYRDAVKWLERAGKENPLNSEAAYHLGRAYYMQNSFDLAIAAFTRALTLEPQYGKAQDNLGLAYAAKNRTSEAEKAYREAIVIGEKTGKADQDPFINLADLLSHAGQNAEALRLLEAAQGIGGVSERVARLRGQIFLAEDKPNEAETELRSAIALNPDNGSLHYLLGRVLSRQGKAEAAEKEFREARKLMGSRSSVPN